MALTISETLAGFVRETTYSDLPREALAAAKWSLLDTLAVAIGARGAAGVREAVDMAVEEAGAATSSIWMVEQKVPPRTASFANSLMASALDFDSLHAEAVVHADIVIVPTAIAVCEATAASGKDVLTAIVVGDDILCRLGLSTRQDTGWFYTSVYGTLASAAITAKLLGADAPQIAGAMGLGFMSSSGTQQPAVERSVGKRMQGALAASTGVFAGYLGARGVNGPREVVEGRFGLYAMYEKGERDTITRDLGRRFENSGTTYKLYPSCQCNHAAIEGMLQLKRELDLAPEEVRSVEVFLSEYMYRLVGAPFSPGDNPQVAAQFSVQYSIASVLLYGRLGVVELRDSAVRDPRIIDLASRVVVTLDPENRNNFAPVRIRIVRTDGQVIDRTVSTYRGNSDLPLTPSDMKEKIAMCIDGAGHLPNHAQVDAFFDAIMNIDQEPSVGACIPRILRDVFP